MYLNMVNHETISDLDMSDVLGKGQKLLVRELLDFSRAKGYDVAPWVSREMVRSVTSGKLRSIDRYNVPGHIAIAFMAYSKVPMRRVDAFMTLVGRYYAPFSD